MIRRPQRSTITDTRLPYTTLFRSLPFPIQIRAAGVGPQMTAPAAVGIHVGDDVKHCPGQHLARHGIDGVEQPVEEALHPPFRLRDRKSTRLHSSHYCASRMPSSACKKI